MDIPILAQRQAARSHQDIATSSAFPNDLPGMDLEALSRKELQALAKQFGVKANLKNTEIIQLLKAVTGNKNKDNIAPTPRIECNVKTAAVVIGGNDENAHPNIVVPFREVQGGEKKKRSLGEVFGSEMEVTKKKKVTFAEKEKEEEVPLVVVAEMPKEKEKEKPPKKGKKEGESKARSLSKKTKATDNEVEEDLDMTAHKGRFVALLRQIERFGKISSEARRVKALSTREAARFGGDQARSRAMKIAALKLLVPRATLRNDAIEAQIRIHNQQRIQISSASKLAAKTATYRNERREIAKSVSASAAHIAKARNEIKQHFSYVLVTAAQKGAIRMHERNVLQGLSQMVMHAVNYRVQHREMKKAASMRAALVAKARSEIKLHFSCILVAAAQKGAIRIQERNVLRELSQTVVMAVKYRMQCREMKTSASTRAALVAKARNDIKQQFSCILVAAAQKGATRMYERKMLRELSQTVVIALNYRMKLRQMVKSAALRVATIAKAQNEIKQRFSCVLNAAAQKGATRMHERNVLRELSQTVVMAVNYRMQCREMKKSVASATAILATIKSNTRQLKRDAARETVKRSFERASLKALKMETAKNVAQIFINRARVKSVAQLASEMAIRKQLKRRIAYLTAMAGLKRIETIDQLKRNLVLLEEIKAKEKEQIRLKQQLSLIRQQRVQMEQEQCAEKEPEGQAIDAINQLIKDTATD